MTEFDYLAHYFDNPDEMKDYNLMYWCLQNRIHPLPEEAILHKDDERYWMNLIDYLGARQEYEKYILTKIKQI
jgi:hypothetical protein